MRPVWFCLFLLGCSFPLSAQQPRVSDLTGLSLEDLARTSLSTASRHLEDQRRAPARVTIISREEILRFGWRTLGELLRSVPEFYTAYDRDYTYVGVRGFQQSGDYNARILFLIDGHRINDNIYDSGLIGTEFPLDMNLIDHVEVVCGPGSSLFGTNAELAVVNVFTRRAENRSTAELETEDGSFTSRMAEVTSTYRTAGTNVIASASLFRSNGASQLSFPDFYSPDTNWGLARHLDGDRFDHAFAAIRHGGLHVEGLWGSRTKIVPNASYDTNFSDPGNRSVDTRGYIDAAWSHSIHSGTDLDLRTYYDSYRYFGSFPYGGADSPDRIVQINDALNDWVGSEAVISQKIGGQRLVGGVAGEYNLRAQQRNYYLKQSPFLDDRRHPGFQAAFGEAELNPRSWLSLNLGGRVDHYNTFGSAASPRIAAMIFPDARTAVKYVLGGSFRAPDAYDEYYVNYVDIDAQNRNLRPEHSEAQTLLIERQVSESAHVSGELFRTNLKGTIEKTLDPATGLTHFANQTGERGRGLNLAIETGLSSGWSARASFTGTRTEPRPEGTPVINSPNTLVKLNGVAPLARYANLGLELLYAGPQESYQGTRVASSFLTNATVSASWPHTGWDFSASCYDLLDRRWSTPTGPEISEPATEQDGRTWRVRLQYRYSLPGSSSRP